MTNKIKIQRRIQRELESHTVDDVLAESYKLKDRFKHIMSYPSRRRLIAEFDRLLEDVNGKVILDYGCGRGKSSIKYLSNGAIVYGIDISPNYIAESIQQAEKAKFPKEQYQFRVVDAHKLDFPENSFDLVVGEGILHHLEAEIALNQIYRVLKPGGRVLLQEPLADNPLLKLFRALTPHARTEDERPFSGQDVSRLVSKDSWLSETKYCGIFEAPVAVITSVLLRDKPDNWMLRAADLLEHWIHEKGWLLSWNQYILFNLIKHRDINV